MFEADFSYFGKVNMQPSHEVDHPMKLVDLCEEWRDARSREKKQASKVFAARFYERLFSL